MSALPTVVPLNWTVETPAEVVQRIFLIHPLHGMFLMIPIRCCPLSNGTTSAKPCIPTTVILDACAIVTGSYNGGRLFRDREGRDPVLPCPFLEAGQYFYVLDGNPAYDYPLFSTFDAWVPPGRFEVPDYWFCTQRPKEQTVDPGEASWVFLPGGSRSVMSGAARNLDRQCLLSGYSEPLEGVHIIPSANGRWYVSRKVVKQLRHPNVYPTGLASSPANHVHDVRNFLTLRVDLHRLWDAHAFFFVPSDDFFMPYFIKPFPSLHATKFHLKKAVCHDRTDPYLLFIRFAMAIFSLRSWTPDAIAHPRQIEFLKGTTEPRSAGPSKRANLKTTEEGDVEMEETAQEEVGRDDMSDTAELAELEDGPQLLVKIYEDEGLELPADLAAAWIPVDENIEALKVAWIAANPQISQRSETPPMVSSDSQSSKI